MVARGEGVGGLGEKGEGIKKYTWKPWLGGSGVLEYRPVHQKAAGLILGLGRVRETINRYFSLTSMFLSLSLPRPL